jgi:excisionase family DNA binding protein
MLMTVREAATYLRCHTSTIYRLLRENQLPGVKIGNQWRIDTDILASHLGIESVSQEETKSKIPSARR